MYSKIYSKRLYIAIVLIVGFILSINVLMQYQWGNKPTTYIDEYKWNETTLKVYFKNNTVDTFKVDIYGEVKDTQVENGNLLYYKSHKGNRFEEASRLSLASNVNYFKVLDQKLIIKRDTVIIK